MFTLTIHILYAPQNNSLNPGTKSGWKTHCRLTSTFHRGCRQTLGRTAVIGVCLTLEQTRFLVCRNTSVPAPFVFARTDDFDAIAKMRCQKRAIAVGEWRLEMMTK